MQRLLFDALEQRCAANILFKAEIAGVLGINEVAAGRLINGSTKLKAETLCRLASHYNLSLDELLQTGDGTAVFNYRNLDVFDLSQYDAYMQGLLANLRQVHEGKDREVIFVADDVPIFHFMHYPLLTYFKLYAWNRDINSDELSFERFMDALDRDSMERIFQSIAEMYCRIPSIEIWTTRTISPFLSQIAYFHKLNCFEDPSVPLALCGQLKELVKRVERYATCGKKGVDEGASFDMVKSPVDPGRGLLYTVCDGQYRVTLKLYSINGMTTTDTRYCEETGKVLKGTYRKSIQLSGTSEAKRKAFFELLYQKITEKCAKLEVPS